MPPTLSGSFWILLLYDVCDEIRLDSLRKILGAPPAGREPTFRHPAPEYVRFERPPVVEVLEPLVLETGECLKGRLQYYEYGVVSIELELRFELGWNEIVNLSSRWIAADIEKMAAGRVERRLARAEPALSNPYNVRLSEDYYIVHIRSMAHDSGEPVSAAELIASYGDQIAQIVRGESSPLSEDERTAILQSRMSYFPHDLAVVGWTAAFLYDTPEGAASIIQLLEYANTQLLEFRHYDDVLTRLLAGVYDSMEKHPGLLARWRLAGKAQRLNAIRLEVRELTERIDNSIKFLSDMFSARFYRLAAARVGVSDYRKLVDDKLQIAGDLYQFMMDEFRQGRAFVLELMVVIILIIELVFLFRGKS
jgi:hypothetical protein